MPEIKLDSAETIYFERELNSVKTKTYDRKYPELMFGNGKIIPISTSEPEYVKTISYQQWDTVGIAQWIANYADDLPRADVVAEEFVAKVKEFGAAYGYSIMDIKTAKALGKSLEQRKANATKRSAMQKQNAVGFSGDTLRGIEGFNTNPNMTEVDIPSDGTAGKLWSGKTSEQKLRDMNLVANAPFSVTNGVEQPNTFLMDIDLYTDAVTSKMGGIESTVMEFFKKTNPFIKEVIPAFEMKTAGASNAPRLMAYKKDIDSLSLEIPMMYTQLPVQEKNLEFVVNTMQRTGGVIWYYPLTAAFGDFD
jgi:hypothetical protein